MPRALPLLILLLAAAGCAAPPVRWEKPGAPAGGAAADEASCRTGAHEEAARRLPYGNGPPIYGVYREMSMLQWTMLIDNERTYLEERLVKSCMRARGYSSSLPHSNGEACPERSRRMPCRSLAMLGTPATGRRAMGS